VCRAVLVGALFAIAARPLPAQGSPPAFGRQNLDFGTVIPGLPTVIDPTDRAQAGRFEIRGTGRSEVRIDLTLPSDMLSLGGDRLPLQFAASDGGFSTQPSLASMITFDPRTPLVTRLSNGGRLYIWLGGTAVPSGAQPPGSYHGGITMTVTYTGND